MYQNRNFDEEFEYVISKLGDAFISNAKWRLGHKWDESLGKYMALVHFYTTEQGKEYNNELKRYSSDPLVIALEYLWNHSLDVLHQAGKIKPFDGFVFRGSSREDNDGICDKEVGETFEQYSLLSSSVDYMVASEWYEDGVIIHIISKTAFDITSYTEYQREAEVLFRSKTRFRVLEKTLENPNLLVIFIEETH